LILRHTAVVAVIVTAGCGGSPTAPSEVPSAATPTPPPTPTAFSFTFTYDDGVSTQDRGYIEAAANGANDFFQSEFGRQLAGRVRIVANANAGPPTAQGGNGTVTIFTTNNGWLIAGRIQRTRIVAHELFHILQEQVGWQWMPGVWLSEGSAEYVGLGTAAFMGLTNTQEVKTCQISRYFGANNAASRPLEELDFSSASTDDARYLIAWLAVDKLLSGSSASTLRRFWESAGSWDNKFTTAFGIAPSDFHRDFAQYRQTLRNPGTAGCVGWTTR
jgi:hypothetical protein